MAIKCIVKKSSGLLKEKGFLYPEAVYYSRIDQAKFLDGIEKNFNIGRAQVLAVLSAVADQMEEFVTNGHSVQVPSIGTFSITMNGGAEKRENGKMKLKNAKFDKLRLIPDPDLEKKLQQTKFELLSPEVRETSDLSQEKLIEIMAKLSDETGIFLQTQLESAAGCSHGFATKFLSRMIAEGIVENIGTSRQKIYRLTPKDNTQTGEEQKFNGKKLA